MVDPTASTAGPPVSGATAPPGPLGDLVDRLVARGDRPALSIGDASGFRTISAAWLGTTARTLAAGLIRAGVTKGDPIVLIGPNSIDWVAVRLGIGLSGAVTVAIDDLTKSEDLQDLVRDSGAAYAIASSEHLPSLQPLADERGLRLFQLDPDAADSPPSWRSLIEAATAGDVVRPAELLPDLAPDDAQMLVYTSGTTGKPKGFVLTQRNLFHNIDAICRLGIITDSDRVLMPLPLHHVYPLTVGLLTPLAVGCRLVFPRAVNAAEIGRALRDGDATVMVAVPRLYAALLTGIEARLDALPLLPRTLFRSLHRLSGWLNRTTGVRIGRIVFRPLHQRFAPRLRIMASGGARFDAGLIRRLEAFGWDVKSGWGLAETASILTCNRSGAGKRIGSEGLPLAGMEVRAAPVDTREAETTSGPAGVRLGELQARGPAVFAGYRNDPEANAAAFSDDGWFRSGDLGYIDRDGFVFYAGRVKEQIVLGGGKNIFPEELEKVYGDSPYIQELAVLEQDGSLVALVLPDLEAIAQAGLRNVRDTVRVTLTEKGQPLPRYQQLAGFALTRTPLPRTMLGKYRRFLLPDLYRTALAGADRPPATAPTDADRSLTETGIGARLWPWLQDRFSCKPVTLDASLPLDLGIDSLEWMRLSLELSERFGVQVSDDEASRLTTVRDLLALAADKERLGTLATADPSAASERPSAGVGAAAQAAWLAPRSRVERLAGRGLFLVNRALMALMFRLRAIGAEHLPTHGPYIVIANHVSDLDPQAVAAAIGWLRARQVAWAGDAGRLFGSRAGRFLARAAHIFPASETNPAATLANAARVLEDGGILIWFPEAWRSPTGALQPFQPGIGHLVRTTRVPLYPAHIAGTFEALPRNRRWPRPVPVTVRFGAPLTPTMVQRTDGTLPEPGEIANAAHGALAALARVAERA